MAKKKPSLKSGGRGQPQISLDQLSQLLDALIGQGVSDRGAPPAQAAAVPPMGGAGMLPAPIPQDVRQ